MIVETLIEMRKKWENKGIQAGRKEGIREGMQKGFLNGRQKGIQEGMQKGIVKTAIELLKEGSSVEFVAKVTKLSIREIEKLKKNLD